MSSDQFLGLCVSVVMCAYHFRPCQYKCRSISSEANVWISTWNLIHFSCTCIIQVRSCKCSRVVLKQ